MNILMFALLAYCSVKLIILGTKFAWNLFAILMIAILFPFIFAGAAVLLGLGALMMPVLMTVSLGLLFA